MTLNQIKALIKESEETGWPIQIDEAPGLIDAHWVNLACDQCCSCLHLPEDRFRVAPPEPPKPREWWIRPDPTGGESQAWDASPSDNGMMCKQDGLVRVREVMEDSK